MTKMQNTLQLNAIEIVYIPLSVGTMLTYLSYMIRSEKHKDLYEKGNQETDKIYQTFSVADDAYDLYIKAQYKLMNAIIKSNSSLHQLDIKQQRARYNILLSTLPDLQP